MKKFSSKRALLLSVLSMVICVSMLIGSTFAWFTDSATANVNEIKSGNLDIVLEKQNADGTWSEVSENTALNFLRKGTDGKLAEEANIFWEPGCTYQLPTLRIRNNGNLALKYQIVVSGATGDTMLLDVIKFTAKIDNEDGKEINVKDGGAVAEGELIANGDESVVAISAHMDETANNDYREKSVSGIKISVFATQLNHEFDSNGNDYDKNASLPAINIDALKEALAAGGSVTLGQNLDMTGKGGSEQVNISKDGSVDFNGYKLVGTLEVGTYSALDGAVNVTIKDTAVGNNYSVVANYTKTETGMMKQIAAISVMKPTVTIESGRFSANNAVVNCQVQGVFGADGTQWKFSATNPQPLPEEIMTTLVINGGQFDAVGGGVCLATITGKAIVNGGVFTAEADGAIVYAGSGDSHQKTETIINDGEFTANGEGGVAFYFGSEKGNVVVNGGTFNVSALVGGENGTLVINGGTFNVDPTAYIGEGCTVTANANGTWTVTK